MKPTIVTDINQLLAQLKIEKYDLIAFDADTVYAKADHPLGIQSLLKELRSAAPKCPIVLYANYNQYQNLESLALGEHVELMQKPIKHTSIHMLLTQMQFSKHNAITTTVDIQPTKKENVPKPAQPENGVNILLAEDNRVNQKVATFMLEKLGYKVDVALNGVEVLEKIENDKYDLIFMDCQMPEMDGYEATRKVRQLGSEHHSHNIPIIALTAHAMKSNDEECYAAGMNDYLTKPVRAEELDAILSKWQTEIQAMKHARDERRPVENKET
jgi:CheY-like chemotaxis protein